MGRKVEKEIAEVDRMAELRRKLRRGLAGFLAMCMVATSVNGIAWADEGTSIQNILIKMKGPDIWSAARDAIQTGEQIDVLTVPDEEDKDTASLLKLLKTDNTGSVYEILPDYEMEDNEAAAPDTASFQMFIRLKETLTPEEQDMYEPDGSEQLIVIFKNSGEEPLYYQLDINGKLSERIRVKAYSSVASRSNALPSGGANGGGSQLPEASAQETTEAIESEEVKESTEVSAEPTTEASVEETTVSIEEIPAEETTESSTEVSSEASTEALPEESIEAPTEESAEQSTEAPTEAPVSEPVDSQEAPETAAQETEENQSSDSVSDDSTVSVLSMIRNEVPVLSASYDVATPSNGKTDKGLSGSVKGSAVFEEGYNAVAYVLDMKDVPKIDDSGNFHFTVRHEVEHEGILYYELQNVYLAEDDFEADGTYIISQDIYGSEVYNRGGLAMEEDSEESLLMPLVKDYFMPDGETGKNEFPMLITVRYQLEEGWDITGREIEPEEAENIIAPVAMSFAWNSLPEVQGFETKEQLTYPESIPNGPWGWAEGSKYINHEKKNYRKDGPCNDESGQNRLTDKSKHYVIVYGIEADFVGYIRCDIYSKIVDPPKEDARLVQYILEGDSESFSAEMVTSKEKFYPQKVPTHYVNDAGAPLPNPELEGKKIAYWYMQGDSSKNPVNPSTVKIEKDTVNFIGVLETDPEYHVYYKAHNGNDFSKSYVDAEDITDNNTYTAKNPVATIKGRYSIKDGDYVLVGWTTNNSLTSKSDGKIAGRQEYLEIINDSEFYSFGEKVNVTSDITLYPIWASEQQAQITIYYEVQPQNAGSVSRVSETIFWWTDEAQGSEAKETNGDYRFGEWKYNDTKVGGMLFYKPNIKGWVESEGEWKNRTYVAYFKETDKVKIVYEAVGNGKVKLTGSADPLKKVSEELLPSQDPIGAVPVPDENYVFAGWTRDEASVDENYVADDGTLSPPKENATYVAHFEIAKDATLSITKEFTETSVKPEKGEAPKFVFQISFNNFILDPDSLPSGVSVETDGKKNTYYRVFLGQNGTCKFTGLPRNVTYKVVEGPASNYYSSTLTAITQNGQLLDLDPGAVHEVTGSFSSKKDQAVIFTNDVQYKMMEEYAGFEIVKILKEADPTDNASFVFKIENTDRNSPKYGEVFYRSIMIAKGFTKESIELSGLPVSKSYTVTEEEHLRYTCDRKIQTVDTLDGKAEPGELVFNNTKSSSKYFSDSYILHNKMNIDSFTEEGQSGHIPYDLSSLQQPVAALLKVTTVGDYEIDDGSR